jgi:hypothetical protein
MNTTSGLTAEIVETGSPFAPVGGVNSPLFLLVTGRVQSSPVIRINVAAAMLDLGSVLCGGKDSPIERAELAAMAASTPAKLKNSPGACPVVAFCVTT